MATKPRPKDTRTGMRGTPYRKVRIKDETWDAAKDRAASEETNMSEVLREFIEQYAAGAK